MASAETLVERARARRLIADEYRQGALSAADPLVRAYYEKLALGYENQARELEQTARMVERIEATAARTKARRDTVAVASGAL
jgi:hypothetical protein